MAERRIKNDTDEDIYISDVPFTINAGETVDIGQYGHIHDLALSDELVTRLGNGDFKMEDTDNPGSYYTTSQAVRIITNIPLISPMDDEGRQFLRAESRPLSCTTFFTTAGDDTGIGDGTRLEWDASIDTAGYWYTNDDDDKVPIGMKRHSVFLQFKDSIWMKEGAIYYQDVSKGSFLDMCVQCPHMLVFMYNGQLYVNITGDWLTVDHYLNRHPIQGSVPMGDELNTETCSQELSAYLRYRLCITVPEDDVTSYGYMEIEVYRKRTVDLDSLIGTGMVPYTP